LQGQRHLAGEVLATDDAGWCSRSLPGATLAASELHAKRRTAACRHDSPSCVNIGRGPAPPDRPWPAYQVARAGVHVTSLRRSSPCLDQNDVGPASVLAALTTSVPAGCTGCFGPAGMVSVPTPLCPSAHLHRPGVASLLHEDRHRELPPGGTSSGPRSTQAEARREWRDRQPIHLIGPPHECRCSTATGGNRRRQGVKSSFGAAIRVDARICAPLSS